VTEEKKQIKWVSGFWRRIGALLIDGLILGILGQILGIFFETFFVGIGVWGRLIGFSIALIYFGLLNSKIANGQTVGKRLLKIRVVNQYNDPIGIPRSVLRYTILATPFLLNGADLPDAILFSFGAYILSLIVFGGMFSVLYLYFFNRRTRQSFHDLFAGSYVVNTSADFEIPEDIWKPHYYVVGLFCIAAVLVPVLTGSLAKQKPFTGLFETRSAIMENFDVASAGVFYGTSTFTSNTSEAQTTSYVSANVSLRKDDISNESLAKSIAKTIKENYSDARNKNVIQVNLIYGFDIGIASRWSKHSHRFAPHQL
jgi:uncharacterized RDD family membrane protein YckC